MGKLFRDIGRMIRGKKKTSSGRRNKPSKGKGKGSSKAERLILDTASNPNPDAPSNKANLRQNKKIKDAQLEANE